MGFMSRNKKEQKESNNNTPKEKVLEVDASMQGDFHFKDPVNLKINGKFEGILDTKGSLTINEGAIVNAEIKGEEIEIAGTVRGNIEASSRLSLKSSAEVNGDVNTPSFSVGEGAVFNGNCNMKRNSLEEEEKTEEELISEGLMSVEELSEYIDVDEESILEWVKSEKIPAKQMDEDWRFDREEIDSWIASSK